MGANRRREYNQTSYYDGNAVRKLNTIPEIRRETEEIRPVTPKRAPKTRQRRNSAISFMSFLMLTAAIGVTLSATVNYIKATTEISDLNKSISATELELDSLTADNDAALSKINSSIDLQKVFETAVNELGMVFPNKNQVVNYETAICEYVRQYDSVPEANAEELLEKLFK